MLFLFSIATWAAISSTLLPLASGSSRHDARQAPAKPSGVKTITSPNGVRIRYKEPGKSGVCETTPGVNSYSGYVDLNATTHMFFWFFEARKNPATAPITLWLNGGPGADSLIGLFQEQGPCSVTADLKTKLNPYAWNEESNMLYLSQPIGVGFSYGHTKVGWDTHDYHGDISSTPIEGEDEGRYSRVYPGRFDTTYISAVGAWEVLQGFLANLPTLDSTVRNKTFNLWTESYGGHYGPTFFDYFYQQNALIASGKASGVALRMDTLGIINGLIDTLVQTPYYPEFARYNTYGIEAVNETIYNFMKTAYYIRGGCQNYLEFCSELDKDVRAAQRHCQTAEIICRGFVEDPYYYYSGRGVYDIRHPANDPTPPDYFIDYLNQASVQQAIGVSINYTSYSSTQVADGFFRSGDYNYYLRFRRDLERILDKGVRVSLAYGDADWICNWFGGEAVSLAIEYTHSEQFRKAGYVPFMVDGKEYGEVRQYGNFSFLRVYESGHEVPYYQPKAALELFRRVLGNLVLADGAEPVTPDYETNGKAKATHTESFVPLPPSSRGFRPSSSRAVTATNSAAAFYDG